MAGEKINYLEIRWARISIQDAIDIQSEQIRHYSKFITNSEKKKKFAEAMDGLVANNKGAKDSDDIRRGTSIEKLYYNINYGYTDSEYSEMISRLD